MSVLVWGREYLGVSSSSSLSFTYLSLPYSPRLLTPPTTQDTVLPRFPTLPLIDPPVPPEEPPPLNSTSDFLLVSSRDPCTPCRETTLPCHSRFLISEVSQTTRTPCLSGSTRPHTSGLFSYPTSFEPYDPLRVRYPGLPSPSRTQDENPEPLIVLRRIKGSDKDQTTVPDTLVVPGSLTTGDGRSGLLGTLGVPIPLVTYLHCRDSTVDGRTTGPLFPLQGTLTGKVRHSSELK